MKTPVCILTVLMLCCTWIMAPAQPPVHFNRLTKEDGLSSDVIYDLHQDRNGFLWIATHGGLDRYDGYRLKHYRYNPGDSNSLSGNYVHCIKEDKNGLLWITTNNGLNSLDPATGIIKRFVPSAASMAKDMLDFIQMNDSILLINAITTVYAFNKNQQHFSEIKFPAIKNRRPRLSDKFIKHPAGTVFFPVYYLGLKGIYWMSIDWQNNKAELAKDQQSSLNDTVATGRYFDEKGNIWKYGANSMHIRKISGEAVYYPYSNKVLLALENMIKGFFEDGDRMWICTGGGLAYYDYHQNKFHRYRQQPGNAASLSNNRVNCIIKDRNGLYWVGTFGGGVCYFSNKTFFKNITIDTGYSDEARKISGLQALHSGRILVNTMADKRFMLKQDKGLHELDYAKDFKPLLLDALIREFTGREVREISARDSIALRKHFNLRHGLTNKKIGPGIILPYPNKIWIHYSTDKLLYDGTVHPYKPELNGILPIANNHLLFATSNGLVEFDANIDSAIRTWLPQPGNPYSIGSNWITYLLPDGKGNYWIGTADAGFDYWDVKTDKFYHYTTKDGLADNKIYSIFPDKKGRLWMSTDNGLSCFDIATRSFTNYSKVDGLVNTEYNSDAACVDKAGWFYFGGMGGIDYFHPDSIKEQRPVPVLYLASFRIYDKEQPLNSSYKLATNDNNIHLEFTANDFANASKLLFRYKLAGVDEKWISTQGNNTALYNKLPHGKYSFSVMGSYDGRSWSRPLVVDFTIATPWFQSWWFYALLVLAIISGIYAFFNYRLQRQLEKQQAVENIRSKISMDIHDEIGSQLTKISLLSQRIKIAYKKQKEVDEALINKITQSSKEVVGNLGEIIWAVNPKHDNLQSLLAYLRNYIPVFFEQTNVDHVIDFPDEVPAITISPELKHNLFLVIKESLNNIIKHAAATEVKISFQFNGQTFFFEIADNGKGIAGLNGRDFGNGLANMKNRMRTVNGKCEIISEINKGTSIRLQGNFSV